MAACPLSAAVVVDVFLPHGKEIIWLLRVIDTSVYRRWTKNIPNDWYIHCVHSRFRVWLPPEILESAHDLTLCICLLAVADVVEISQSVKRQD